MGDLYNFIEKQGTLTEQIASTLMKQIVSALEFCHGKGYVHHDVKLENSAVLCWQLFTLLVLLIRENEVVLSDFGFSHHIPLSLEGEERKIINTFSGR